MSCMIPVKVIGAVGGVGAVTGLVTTTSLLPVSPVCTITLKVVVISSMNSGVCYLVYDPIQKKLFRPLKNGMSYWPLQELRIDMMYLFTLSSSPSLTSLPHSREDLHVENWVEIPFDNLNVFHTMHPYYALDEIAQDSVELIFGSNYIHERKYVFEGTNCPSVGILRCQGEQMQFYYDINANRRLKIGLYDFPYKAATVDVITPFRPALIVLGLARPYDGEGNFNPRRCYLLALRVLAAPGYLV